MLYTQKKIRVPINSAADFESKHMGSFGDFMKQRKRKRGWCLGSVEVSPVIGQDLNNRNSVFLLF